ncbi:DEKNAAC103220 [Brettanomyces naardenensis]|uniref:6-phosphogluconate dehydrogenase, decarboxylating n=1 Tax=Brettanomyces naardenensis TaxID=13370 RepID=A0A448YMN8_BRENA|nr:DEKNAAC103220 [Brettanomyces naardenensis]
MSKQIADIAMIGLAVMGQNFVLNMADHGFTVAAFDREADVVDKFIANDAIGKSIIGTHSVEEMVATLKRPRRVMLLIKAGKPVDSVIEQLVPLLEKDDIIIDGGNSHYLDTTRRYDFLKSKGIYFVGSGVSGGEEGARHGPSLMPGGAIEAWPAIKPIFLAVAAKADGEPCCDWVGPAGAGHYVKMVHNGIEYGDMQLISESYDLMKRLAGLSDKEISEVMGRWNQGFLDSFLIEVTRDILAFNDDGRIPLVEEIMDMAGQKGTGKWTAIDALDKGMPVTLIGQAVFSRCLSALKGERARASKVLSGPTIKPIPASVRKQFIDDLEQALYASKIISYAQGFMLIREAAKEFKWDLNFPSIPLMWRGGCIIRSAFLGEITKAYREDKYLENLLFHPFFRSAIEKAQSGWRKSVTKAVVNGIPTPAFATALSFYDDYKSERLPANLLQAQRDYFGAHTFSILPKYAHDKVKPGKNIHINWTGKGVDVSAGTYDA